MAETNGLLNRRTGQTVPRVRISPLPQLDFLTSLNALLSSVFSDFYINFENYKKIFTSILFYYKFCFTNEFLTKMRNPYLNKEGKFWYLYFFVNGKVRKRSTKETIRSKAENFKSRFIQNDYELTEPKYISLSDFKIEWLEIISGNCKPKTIKSYENAFNQLTLFTKDIYLHQISLKDINKFLSNKSKESSEWTARKYRTSLRTAFNYAVKMKYLKENYFIDSVKFNPATPDILFFSDFDFKKLLEVIDNEIYKDIVLFGFYSGMRLGEILSIKKNNIYDKIIILESNTKNKKPRIVSLSNELIPIIEKYKNNNSEFLFGKNSVNTVSHIFSKYKKRAGINPKLNFHSLRKTFGSKLLNAGVDLKVISEMLGHSSYKVTEQFYATLLKGFRNEVNLIKMEGC